jgi:hypothetical protein
VMSYRIAGIDVHKKMLAVVVSDVEIEASTSSSGECYGLPRNPSRKRRSNCPFSGDFSISASLIR